MVAILAYRRDKGTCKWMPSYFMARDVPFCV